MWLCVPFTVSKSKSSHEDVGRDQGKFVSGGCRGEDPCSFLHRLRAERAEPFAEGLALGVELDGQRPPRTCARRSAATAWDPSPATAWVPSVATAWGASAATAWDALRQPCGALDMLHRNKEHAWKSFHF